LGRFFVRASSADPMIFLAGGSGLSSPRSMVLDLLEKGWIGPITLIHGVRTVNDLYYSDDFVALSNKHKNFQYEPVLSEHSSGSEWSGSVGFVHQIAEQLFEGMFKGLFEKDIFTETFLTKSDGESLAKSPLFKKI
jgi:phenol hydroxylase P5 protein